ncbi:MAG: hypothetical protein K1X74_16985 [Pirellulales bacterium]|nr:hypothetical protein [Pirellulales bacterium]
MNTPANSPAPDLPPGRKRWRQFSLRTLLGVTTLVAVVLGRELNLLRQRDQALRALDAAGIHLKLSGPVTGLRARLGRIAGLYGGPISPQLMAFGQLSDETCRSLGRIDQGHFKIVMVTDSELTDAQLTMIAPACAPQTAWLNQCRLTDRSADVLASWKLLADLRLDRSHDVSDATVARLESLRELAYLSLVGTKVNGRGFRFWPVDRKLSHLVLDDSPVDDGGAAAITQLQTVRTLWLARTQMTDQGVNALSRLRVLESLTLDGDKITGAGFAGFAANAPLNELSLNRTQVDDEGLAAIARLRNLKHLRLDQTKITDAGLAQLRALDQLTVLSLAGCRLTDDALSALAEFPNLHYLDLSGTKITDAGIERLAAIATLERLIVKRTGVTQAGLDRLKQRLPMMEVDD